MLSSKTETQTRGERGEGREGFKEEMSLDPPKGAGCELRSGDTAKIVGSVACFASFLVYGACQGALGAALPSLSAAFGLSEGNFGIVYSLRGLGYLVGTLGSAALLEFKSVKFVVSTEVLVCVSVVSTGLATGLVVAAAGPGDYSAVLFLFFFQGLGFGGIDTLANCVLPEIWGQRVQPWMQAMHSFFGVGAVVGPALVGGFGFRVAFVVLALSSGVPLAGLLSQASLRSSPPLPLHEDKDKDKVEVEVEANTTEETEQCRHEVVAAQPEDGPVPPDVALVAAEPATRAPQLPLPALSVRLLLALFFFVYVGVECAFGAWISTYSLRTGVTASEEDAAFVASIYWAALTVGRVVAIPLAINFSTTSMLRAQLFLAVIGAVLTATIADRSYSLVCAASAVFGYALSSIFPLAMTMVLDYGFFMDGPTTSLFVVGATFGEGVVPACLGLAMDLGPEALPYCTCAGTFVVIVLYITTHKLLLVSTKRNEYEYTSATNRRHFS